MLIKPSKLPYLVNIKTRIVLTIATNQVSLAEIGHVQLVGVDVETTLTNAFTILKNAVRIKSNRFLNFFIFMKFKSKLNKKKHLKMDIRTVLVVMTKRLINVRAVMLVAILNAPTIGVSCFR